MTESQQKTPRTPRIPKNHGNLISKSFRYPKDAGNPEPSSRRFFWGVPMSLTYSRIPTTYVSFRASILGTTDMFRVDAWLGHRG